MTLDWRTFWVSALSWFWNPVLLRAQGLLRSEWVTQSLSTKVTQEGFRINPEWPLGSFVSVLWELWVLAFYRTPALGKMKARLKWADGVSSLLGAAFSQVRSVCSLVRVLLYLLVVGTIQKPLYSSLLSWLLSMATWTVIYVFKPPWDDKE